VRAVDGLVLSSPLLAMRLNPGAALLMRGGAQGGAEPAVGNGVDAGYLSHDPAVVQAYRIDPLVHDRIGAGSRASSRRRGKSVQPRAPLVGADVAALRRRRPAGRPGGSRAFAAAAHAGHGRSALLRHRCTTRSSTSSKPSRCSTACGTGSTGAF
jgi:hypothetical protein